MQRLTGKKNREPNFWYQDTKSCRTVLSKAAGYPLKPVQRLLKDPPNNPSIVVTETQVVVQSRETVGLARLLHFVQLGYLKPMVFDCAPVVAGGIHRKAGRKGAIGADNQGILSGAAVPGLNLARARTPSCRSAA